ncbi:MAG: Gfo/Idh/MocA family protein [Flavobacteriales bacterium]
MLKIGVVGTGHLGKIHLHNCMELTNAFEVIGFYDINPETRAQVAQQFQLKSFEQMSELLLEVDSVIIASSTSAHYALAVQAMKHGKHVFIEKPVCLTSEESKKLLAYSQEAGVIVQVGHVERFNPAFTTALPQIQHPFFMESKRCAPFQSRGTDVSIILDLMIHDIDLALTVAQSNVKRIMASGMEVVSQTIDFASARLEFENGFVANLTASRVEENRIRTTTFFMDKKKLEIDFLLKEVQQSVMDDSDEANVWKQTILSIEDKNAIQMELLSFAEAIRDDKMPLVSLTDGHRALQIAELIHEQITSSNQFLK